MTLYITTYVTLSIQISKLARERKGEMEREREKRDREREREKKKKKERGIEREREGGGIFSYNLFDIICLFAFLTRSARQVTTGRRRRPSTDPFKQSKISFCWLTCR